MPRWNNQYRVIAAPGFIEPCHPTRVFKAPSGPLWIHEIKQDGYRLMVRRRDDRIRIYTKRGADWTDRYPAIAAAAAALKAQSFYLDGEGVICSDNGLAVWSRLHSRVEDATASLQAFDLLELDGEDLRPLPLLERKKRLKRLLGRRRRGIVYTEHLAGDGPIIFAQACALGCEGIVSKRADLSYGSGRSKAWLKTKNPAAPAALRLVEEDIG